MQRALDGNEMRALLVNDTGGEANPGCRAATAAIVGSLRSAGYEITTLPLGYWSDDFRTIDTVRRKALSYEGTRFPAWVPSAEDVDFEVWEAVRQSLLARDAPLRALFSSADLVLINGEGSIHHNLPRALGLLALAASATALGIRTHLVNATVQAMSPALLQAALPSLALVHVREQRSYAAVEAYVTKTLRLSVDLAFAGDYHSVPEPSTKPGGKCLLTAGVGAHPRYLSLQIEAVRTGGWEPVYLLIGDGSEREVASRACAEHGVELVDAAEISWQDFPAFLSRFPVAVSGRHHVNIFLLLAGVPLIPLPSNTWKIEETLALVQYPQPPVPTAEALQAALEAAGGDLEAMARAARTAGERGRHLVTGIL